MREWITSTALSLYAGWLPIAWIAFAVSVLILTPLAFIRRANPFATTCILGASYVIGFTLWLLGLGITFGAFGWLGLLIGLLIFGAGVVPVGIVGAFFKFDNSALAISMIVMAVIVFGLRFLAIYLRERMRSRAP